MNRLTAAVAALGLALSACAPQSAGKPQNLAEIEGAHDWQHEQGKQLNADFEKSVKALLMGIPRPDAIAEINAAGFECTYGEAHQDYPDPMAVCTRSFATRACQMDWEIWSTADKGKVNDAGASFKRDCVGTADDYPDPAISPIDDQLAPAKPPAVPGG